MPKLIVNGPDMEEREVQCEADVTTIGRLETNALVLPAANVSREHAHIVTEGKDSFLLDLGSENGTAVNDVIVRANEKYLLQHNDAITIGPYRLKFSRLDPTIRRGSSEQLEQSFNDITDSDILEVKLLKKVLAALDKETTPSIEVLNGASEGKKLLLAEDLQTVIVGRDPTVDFPIEEYVVSRRHAKVVLQQDGWTLQDLESKNGTYVNNSRITENVLHDGDRIAFGTIVCIFRNPRDVNLAAVSEHVKEVRQAQSAAQRLKEITKKEEEAQPSGEEEKEETGSEATAPPDGGAAELPTEDELKERELAHEYPIPQPATARIRFSPFEIGLLWMGTVVFLVTVVLLVKLLS